MRILVGWDDAAEAETVELYLNVDDNVVQIATDAAAFLRAAEESIWDVVLMAVSFPSRRESLTVFERVRAVQPTTPIVGACHPAETVQVSRFMARGLKSYVTRDVNGEFMFLLTSMIESAHTSSLTEQTQQLADRLRQEIESVRRLQESVIPHDLPAPPGYRVTARYEPSQIQVLGNQPVVMAGGDYYDLFNLDPDRLVFLVGDASGHGMKACMSIMTMHTLIAMIRSKRYQDTAHFVDEVNRRLCENNIIQDQGGFITFLYCTLDLRTHNLQWTSAGHPMPMLQNLETNEIVSLAAVEEAGLPLGITTDMPYEVCNAHFSENCRLLLYTDGLSEAFPEGSQTTEQFGEAGIVCVLKSAAKLPIEQALDTLFVKSSQFTRGSGRHDDTSAVLVERLRQPPDSCAGN